MAGTLATYIILYVFSTARRVFTFSQVLPIARRHGNNEFVLFLEDAIEFDRETLRMEALWRESRLPQSKSRGQAAEIDNAIDRVIGAMFGTVQRMTTSLPQHHPLVETGKTFLRSVFPNGAQPVVTLKYEDQLGTNEEMIERFVGPLAADIAALGIKFYVEELQVLVPKFRAELERTKPVTPIAFDVLRAAREQGQENLLGVVAFVMGQTYTNSPDHVALRGEYLAPIYEQNDRIRAHRQGRRKVTVDVNPDTGEEYIIEDGPDEPGE